MKFILYSLLLAPFTVFATEKCEWKVVSIEGYPTIKTNQPTINFDREQNRVYGKASCNSYFGSYKQEGDNITFDKIGSTLMACFPDEINAQETKFINELSKVSSISHAGDTDIYLDKGFNKLFETRKCK